jgi:hypothetical protein
MKADDTSALNRQLEAYAAVAKLPERYSPNRWRNWAIYAAATGAALAGASAASAEIIYSGPQNIGTHGSMTFSLGFPIDLDGNHDFFNAFGSHGYNVEERAPESFAAHASAAAGGTGTRRGGLFTTGKGSAKNFAPGARISGVKGLNGGGVLFSQFLGIPRECTGFPLMCTTGPIVNNARGRFEGANGTFLGSGAHATGFLGVEFNGKTSRGRAGAREYGWVRLRVSGRSSRSFGAFFPRSVTVIDWAYNTDGAILAGQTSGATPPAVPEPSTMPIMLLAAGAGGVLEWKRRRQSAKA